MTNKKREKNCATCGSVFLESKRDSEKQWMGRLFCSKTCSNRSGSRVTNIFLRLERYQVKNESGCWSWTGTKDAFGYGNLSNRRGGKFSPEKAHIVSYEKHFGMIENNLHVCHKCDNPECTNPYHLFLGTQKENMIDCSRKGRINKKSLLNLRPGSKGILGAGKFSIGELRNGKFE